jgi:tRNA1(Val) A37 N6-methylase TrmN6
LKSDLQTKITSLATVLKSGNAFDWHTDFCEIFQNTQKKGFDIVIGNPPYIQLQKIPEEANRLKGVGYESFTRTGDIYCLFYEQGYRLLAEHGFLTFITSNKWMRAGYGQTIRSLFSQKTNPLK